MNSLIQSVLLSSGMAMDSLSLKSQLFIYFLKNRQNKDLDNRFGGKINIFYAKASLPTTIGFSSWKMGTAVRMVNPPVNKTFSQRGAQNVAPPMSSREIS